MIYLCWKADDPSGATSGPGTPIEAGSVGEAAQRFVDLWGGDGDQTLAIVMEGFRRWRVHFSMRMVYTMGSMVLES